MSFYWDIQDNGNLVTDDGVKLFYDMKFHFSTLALIDGQNTDYPADNIISLQLTIL